MKLNIKDLSHALKPLMRVAGNESIMPILAGMKLTQRDGRVKLSTTDLDRYLTTELQPIEADDDDRTVVVNADTFNKIVHAADDDVAEIEIDLGLDRTMTVFSGDAKHKLFRLPKEDYPHYPDLPKGISFTVDPDRLASLLKLADMSVLKSREKSRLMLTGVFFNVDKGVMDAVSTNGYRMSVNQMPVTGDVKTDFILPHESATDLIQLLKSFKGDEVKVTTDGNLAMFDFDGYSFISRVLGEEYPAYQKVVPSDVPEASLSAYTDDLRDAVNAAKLTSVAINHGVVLSSVDGSGVISVSSSSSEVGDAKSQIKGDTDGDLELRVRAEYLADVMVKTASERVTVSKHGEAVRIVPSDPVPNEADFQFIVMQLKDDQV